MSFAGTFGHTPSTDGDYVAASAGSDLLVNDLYGTTFTLARAVTVSSISMRIYSGSSVVSGHVAIYSTVAGIPVTKLAQKEFTSQTLAASTTYSFTLATALELAAGSYSIAVFIYARSGGPSTLAYDASGTQLYATPGGVAPPASWPGSYTTQTRTAHVWADYTAVDQQDFPTAEEVINDAGIGLALWETAKAEPYTSTEQNVRQMVRLLKGLGRKLYRARAWSHLLKEHSFDTEASEDTYLLPDDWARSVDDTQWDQTGTQPLWGPESAQSWAEVNGRSITGLIGTTYRVLNGEIILRPVPSSVSTLSLWYVSRYWVRPSGEALPTSSTPSAGTDALCFDAELLVAGLKLLFAKAKGLDTSDLAPEYAAAWADAVRADSPARTISLGAGCIPKLIGYDNVPEGSWS